MTYMNKIITSLLVLTLMSSMSLQARKVTGSVKCGDAKLSGVMVTDGEHFTQTGRNGKFSFDISDDADFVYIVTPAGYVADWTTGVPSFYKPASGADRFDFCLQRMAGGNDYDIVAVSDPQFANQEQVEIFAGRPMEDMCRTIAGLSPVSVGLALGDICWDSFPILEKWGSEIVRAGIPFYPVAGNHDHDHYSQGDEAAILRYRSILGPENYAFLIGKDAVIVLDNIIYQTEGKYDCGYTERQLDWVRKLVSLLPHDADLYVAQHSPLVGWDGRRIHNAGALLDILRGRKVSFLSGHTHENNVYVYEKDIMEHNVASICGAWWDTQLCVDGTPGGYKVFTKSGDRLSWYYKSWAHGKDYQMKVYAPGEVKSYANGVVVNVWDQDPGWKVEWYEDGVPMGKMEQAAIASPAYTEEISQVYAAGDIPGWKQASRSRNNFTALPSRDAKSVTVVAENRFGRKYVSTVHVDRPEVRIPVRSVEDIFNAMDMGANTIVFEVIMGKDGVAAVVEGPLLAEAVDAAEAYAAEKGCSPVRFHFNIRRGAESYDKCADAVMGELIYRYIADRVTVSTDDRFVRNFIAEKYPEFRIVSQD